MPCKIARRHEGTLSLSLYVYRVFSMLFHSSMETNDHSAYQKLGQSCHCLRLYLAQVGLPTLRCLVEKGCLHTADSLDGARGARLDTAVGGAPRPPGSARRGLRGPSDAKLEQKTKRKSGWSKSLGRGNGRSRMLEVAMYLECDRTTVLYGMGRRL